MTVTLRVSIGWLRFTAGINYEMDDKDMRLILTAMMLFSSTVFAEECIHLNHGTPKQSDFMDCRLGYAIGYNYARKSLDWVAYELNKQVGEGVDRTDDFRIDPEIPVEFQTSPTDYEEPTYDQGHMANSESIDGSDEMMSETFLMSNILPQLPKNNRAIWKGLENRERKIANKRGKVFVYAGPLYEGEVSYIGNKVPVPTAFWKIIYDPSVPEAIAYIIDHKPLKTSELKDYLVNVDQIEFRTGMNFFEPLGDLHEDLVEDTTWKFVWVE